MIEERAFLVLPVYCIMGSPLFFTTSFAVIRASHRITRGLVLSGTVPLGEEAAIIPLAS